MDNDTEIHQWVFEELGTVHENAISRLGACRNNLPEDP